MKNQVVKNIEFIAVKILDNMILFRESQKREYKIYKFFFIT